MGGGVDTHTRAGGVSKFFKILHIKVYEKLKIMLHLGSTTVRVTRSPHFN